jgi:hypothetical protein
MVAVDPPLVTTVTVVSEIGTEAVVVEPPGVRMCETVAGEANGTDEVPPLTVFKVTEVAETTDGEVTKADDETGTVTPDWVTTGDWDELGAV